MKIISIAILDSEKNRQQLLGYVSDLKELEKIRKDITDLLNSKGYGTETIITERYQKREISVDIFK